MVDFGRVSVTTGSTVLRHLHTGWERRCVWPISSVICGPIEASRTRLSRVSVLVVFIIQQQRDQTIWLISTAFRGMATFYLIHLHRKIVRPVRKRVVTHTCFELTWHVFEMADDPTNQLMKPRFPKTRPYSPDLFPKPDRQSMKLADVLSLYKVS